LPTLFALTVLLLLLMMMMILEVWVLAGRKAVLYMLLLQLLQLLPAGAAAVVKCFVAPRRSIIALTLQRQQHRYYKWNHCGPFAMNR
jgi:hypothetical protein